MTANTLLSKAVDLACARNPSLVIEPYYQMKAAALIIAEMVVKAREAGATIEIPGA
jgi:hypothetical protein